MYRYLGVTWDASDDTAAAESAAMVRGMRGNAQWEEVINAPGLVVLQAGVRAGTTQACALHDRGGVVLGTLFSRTEAQVCTEPQRTLSADASRRVIESEGRHLIEQYWGRYVAFVLDRRSHRCYVLRDPSGGLPCYVTATRGVHVYFSRPSDCAPLGLQSFAINWRFVRAYLVHQGLQVAATGLENVTEVQPGEVVSLRAGTPLSNFLWHPFRVAATDPIEDVDTAVSALRDAAISCIGSWAACYPRIIHMLSGGLDSSISLWCLARAPSRPVVTGLNYYTATGYGDERPFARLAVKQVGCELIEVLKNPTAVRMERALSIERSPRPLPYLYFAEHSAAQNRLAEELGATVITSGSGGDGLFYQARPGLATADYFKCHGFDRRFLSIALNAAALERISIWALLKRLWRDHRGSRHVPWTAQLDVGKYQCLVNPELVKSFDPQDSVHPWLKSSEAVLPGKLWQTLSISVPHPFYAPLQNPDSPERLPVLVTSQPLMEVCLRIPTYVLTSGGVDRAIARRAFADLLPRQIIARRGKGGINEHVKRVFSANTEFIRQMLLDGLLVANGLLDRSRLEATLSERHTGMGLEFSELLEHLSTELWLRSWSENRKQAAA